MAKIIKSVSKAVDILNCFYEHEELGIADLVKLVDMSKSTIFDLVNTLAANEVLEQNLENSKYRLGIRLFELGSLYSTRNPISEVARRYGEELAVKHNATIHLATHRHGQVIYLDKFESPGALVSYSRAGKRAPMSCTGLGKAMLAFLPETYKEEYVTSQPLPKLTENSITSVEELDKNLKLVHQRGYAIDDEEIELGLRCVAAPIYAGDQVVGAMSISMLAPYATAEKIGELAKDIIVATQTISKTTNTRSLLFND